MADTTCLHCQSYCLDNQHKVWHDTVSLTTNLVLSSPEEWSDCSSTSKDAQPSAGVEEGRGDSPQNQGYATRPAEQVEGERESSHSIKCI